MGQFERKVDSFFSELGVSDKKIQSFLESGAKNYRHFLNQKGARRLRYEKDVRNVIKHRGLVLPRVKVIIASTSPTGDKVTLAQEDETKRIVFPSETVEEWLYYGKTAIEPPTLTAYNKFYEVIGKKVDIPLEYIGETTSTNVQENRDITYEISMYYKAELPYEELMKIEKSGKWRVFLLDEFYFNL